MTKVLKWVSATDYDIFRPMPHGPHHFVALTDMALTIVLRVVAEPEFQFRGARFIIILCILHNFN